MRLIKREALDFAPSLRSGVSAVIIRNERGLHKHKNEPPAQKTVCNIY